MYGASGLKVAKAKGRLAHLAELLDGGKALRAFLLLRCNTATAFTVLTAVTWVTAAALMLWALCLTADHGLWPVAAAGLARRVLPVMGLYESSQATTAKTANMAKNTNSI